MSVYRQSRGPANTCPRCGEALLPTGREGVRHCDRCGGIFADIATSNRILETLDRDLLRIGFVTAMGKAKPTYEEAYPVTCPECQIDMVKHRIESAACTVDACPLHGTWFDTGEFVDVMRALERARKHGIVLTHGAPSSQVDLTEKDLDVKEIKLPKRSLLEWLDEYIRDHFPGA